MNTGIQDAHNVAWMLALAVQGDAAAGLLDSYDAERHPVGEEVAGRTVRSARAGIGADSTTRTRGGPSADPGSQARTALRCGNFAAAAVVRGRLTEELRR